MVTGRRRRLAAQRGGWLAALGAAFGGPAGGALVGGCTAARVTDPKRTATEQFLLSEAAVEAVARLSFDPLRGRRVWVDDRYFAAADAPFVLGQLRAKMLIDGLRLVEHREEAQVVVEVRSGGVGIDRGGFLIGIPPVLGYELSVIRNLEQHGIADVAYVAYWRESGEVVAASGPFVGRSMRDDWWYVGLGPWSRGDIAPVQVEEASAEPGELVEESPLTGSGARGEAGGEGGGEGGQGQERGDGPAPGAGGAGADPDS